MKEILLTFDGGSLGNPGEGYGSYNIRVGDEGEPIFSKQRETYGDNLTNNEAEYMALIKGSEKVIELYGEKIKLHIKGDSQLVVNQINGSYKVKSQNMIPLYREIMKILTNISEYKIEFWGRENSEREFGH
tara:strand:+ start:325 stop:717 length:393 start_codon:yes stop_codon:yes gene_type:complete